LSLIVAMSYPIRVILGSGCDGVASKEPIDNPDCVRKLLKQLLDIKTLGTNCVVRW